MHPGSEGEYPKPYTSRISCRACAPQRLEFIGLNPKTKSCVLREKKLFLGKGSPFGTFPRCMHFDLHAIDLPEPSF